MKNRPILLIILAVLHILEPISKLVYFKSTTGFSFQLILENVTSLNSIKAIFDFWLLFPLCGVLLLFVKKWSYYLFILFECYSIYTTLTYEPFMWPYVSQRPFLSNVVLIVFNVLVLIYVSLPSVRAYFFNKKKRWWETRKRYNVNIPCRIEDPFGRDLPNCDILNISTGGVFVRTREKLHTNNNTKVQFTHNYSDYNFYGKIVSCHKFNGDEGVGVQFLPLSLKDWWKLQRLILEVKSS